MHYLSKITLAAVACLSLSAPLRAEGIFGDGWTLKPAASTLNFQSVKNQSVVESSGFAAYSGKIDPSGKAELRIALDSVDTKVDLRNVRMRFLLFETFQFPEATVTAQIDPAALADLPDLRRKTIDLPYTLSLHGVAQEATAPVVVTYLDPQTIAVSTQRPISVETKNHNLDAGVKKLEEAANVAIVPSASVTFDFIFSADGSGTTAPPAAPAEQPAPSTAALETQGNFNAEECKGRFEILSRTGNIYFRSGSATLDDKSAPLLNSLADIVNRCPDMTVEVSGHTDSDGSAATNQRLSERRAQAVTAYLTGRDVAPDHLVSVGYGEEKPVVPNTSSDNKARNRRIEFAVLD
ncbi:OmpA family protein [Pseudooceanicola sp. C21-150M6]|uniref:OmpA family protein n=1 Tax=Pseudooceanicola sp. C21-150M6 TaxID=3434355 RepID=UPI003D7F9BD0